MKNKSLNINIKSASVRILVFLLLCLTATGAYALSPDFYTESSVLSDGNWRKVKISGEGIVFLSNTQLKNMGFSDPSKVNIYGYGGIPFSDRIDASTYSDDLPIQPCVRTSTGIYFFANSTVAWEAGTLSFPYSHAQNLYGTESYYFVSDRETGMSPRVIDGTNFKGDAISEGTATILHELELVAPDNTGAMFYGEDFRGTPTQTFNFSLPGKSSDDVSVKIAFAANTSNGNSTLKFTANGTALESSDADNIYAVTSSEMICRATETIKNFKLSGDNLALGISFSHNGALHLANLDFIRVNYQRKLDISGGAVDFSLNLNSVANTITITGATSDTQIWDITEQQRPAIVKFDLSGSTARFSPEKGGYRRYVAFNPGTHQDMTVNGSLPVANQNLHSLPAPDLVILTPSEYKSEAMRVASLHEQEDNMLVYVLTPEEVYNEFSSGSANINGIRKMLKMWYDRGEQDGHRLQYFLLFGRGTYDNRNITESAKRQNYARLPLWQHPTGLSESTSYCTDDFFGFLEDGSGAFRMESERLSIGVGRMPVKSKAEAAQAVEKLLSYVKTSDFGDWRNQVMLIADDQDSGQHLEQAENVFSGMTSSLTGSDFVYEKLYLDAYNLKFGGTGNTYPEATARMLKLYNDGVLFVDYIGHGAPKSWGHEGLWTYTQITQMQNKRWPIYLTATCSFGRWDDFDICAAEELWLNPKGGGIAFITSPRVAYIAANGIFNRKITENMFEPLADGRPKRLGDVIREGKNGVISNDDNKLRYVLIGDPAMRVPVPQYKVTLTAINGEAVSESGDIPELRARSKVTLSGKITDRNGNPVSDFSGMLIPTLYDAEKVIQTNGNGEDGKKCLYNDRKNILFRGNTEVKDGEWSVDFTMPIEIENNYSPARLVMYAYTDDGQEAHGSSERLYVYGYDETAADDREGPEITRLVLNSDAFREGDSVNPTPVVLASVSDESGINISSAGIGHQLTIIIDGQKVYDDVSSSFTVTPGNNLAGEIRYQLQELTPGQHELTLTVWDNAGNSSSKTIGFRVSENAIPVLYDVVPNAKPATTSVTFRLLHDSPGGEVASRIEIFDLGGKLIWMGETSSGADASVTWDLTSNGHRVDRGIYLYRASVETPDGIRSTKTKKIAVAAK